MRTSIITLLAIIAFCVIACPSSAQLAAHEYIPDANTVLLDHFNGSTLSEHVSGGVQYVSGFSDLREAVQFPVGGWAREAFPAWFTWTNPTAPEGTVELWVKPTHYDNILTMQWNRTDSAPSAGYIFHLGLNQDGKLSIAGWNSVSSGPENIWTTPFPIGNTTLPLDAWSHVAFTWSPQGSYTYVNGDVDAFSSGNYYPGFNSTVYAYLNYWGGAELGSIDELRISNIARTQFSTVVHTGSVPEPGPFIMIGSCVLAALPFLRRKQ